MRIRFEKVGKGESAIRSVSSVPRKGDFVEIDDYASGEVVSVSWVYGRGEYRFVVIRLK